MSVLYRPVRARRNRHGAVRPLAMEPLESRLLLDSEGVAIGTDVHLTLSFAEDGTQIAQQPSALEATFDAIVPTANWQAAVLQGFQSWAIHTNADIGLVGDGGDPFGTPGAAQRDSRFGDVRVGAIDLDPQVGAVSVAVDELVAGTWFADVVFNSAFDYQSLADILAVATHEAGNVFGLDDNNDPNSPLFTGGPPTVATPTANDIGLLQALHGARLPDANEVDDDDPGGAGRTNNDSFSNAANLKLVQAFENDEGTAPSIVYGDITTNTDLDFFRIRTPGDYSGPVTIQLRTAGVSLLEPRLSVYDENHALIDQVESTQLGGDVLSVVLPSASAEERFFVQVSGADSGVFGIGGYSLVVTYDAINLVDPATTDGLADGSLRALEQDDIAELFENDTDDLNDDGHTDDDLATALELDSTPGFVDDSHYRVIGSIADTTDVDFYDVLSPAAPVGPLEVMTVLVQSLDPAGLVPVVEVFDGNGTPLAFTTLANGGGEYIVQLTGIAADSNLAVAVRAADPAGPFNTGNYSLKVVFNDQPTVLGTMASGTIGGAITQNHHTLYIAQPQLFHLALAADAVTTTVPTAVVATIRNESGQQVYRIAAAPGETRTAGAVLLAPGTYTVEIVAYTADGSPAPAMGYQVLGTAISDPFVGDPNDPGGHPFECTEPGLEGFFCYPGGLVSPDPFLWDSFVDSLTDPPPPLPPPTLSNLLFGDWWSWVWQQAGVNGPPFAAEDRYQIPPQPPSGTGQGAGAGLTLFASVLDNDVEPEGEAMIALLQSSATNGSLIFADDGSFAYAPNPGFMGVDQFTYTAYDFNQESQPATVSLVVGIAGDYNFDGVVDQTDHTQWTAHFGSAETPGSDGNGDGIVNIADYALWRDQLGSAVGFSATVSTAASTQSAFEIDSDNVDAPEVGGVPTVTLSGSTRTLSLNPIVDRTLDGGTLQSAVDRDLLNVLTAPRLQTQHPTTQVPALAATAEVIDEVHRALAEQEPWQPWHVVRPFTAAG